eukprot:Em0006g1331a
MKIAVVFGIVGCLFCAATANPVLQATCPKSKPLVNCFVAPCQVSQCPNFPNAECKDYYCGGCFARYFVGSIEVTSFCNIQMLFA